MKSKIIKAVKCVATFFKKYELAVYALIVLTLAIVLRVALLSFLSGDFTDCLFQWYHEIKGMPYLTGFAADVGDYTQTYKYIVVILTKLPISPLVAYKLTSCVFDVILAVYIGLIVRHITESDLKGLIAYAATLFMPNVFLNSAYWAQCDAIFTSFCVMSVYYIIKKKDIAALALYGVAFSFKLQAVFFAPFLAVAALKGAIRWRSLPFALASYFICGLPALIAGADFYYVYIGVYVGQAQEYSAIALNSANLYSLLNLKETYALSNGLTIFAIGICCLLILIFWKRRAPLTARSAVTVAYTFALIIPFLLPHMHDRYFYLADILGLLFAFLHFKKAYIPAMSATASVLSWLIFLHEADVNLPFLACVNFAAIILLVIFAFKETNEESADMPLLYTNAARGAADIAE